MSEPAAPPPTPIEPWEVLDLLTALVQKSLVVYEEDEQGQGRYRLLETVRQYARDRLLEGAEGPGVRDRHLAFFLQIAECARPELGGPEVAVAAQRLESDHDNLRSALTWSRSAPNGGEAHLRLAAALYVFWYTRGYFREGRQWLEAALSLDGVANAQARVLAFQGAGILTKFLGDSAAAGRWLEEGLALARASGHKQQTTLMLFQLAVLAAHEGDYERAAPYAQEALALSRETGEERLLARPPVAMGIIALHQRDYTAARAWFEEALSHSRKAQDTWHVASVLVHLAAVVQQEGDDEQARALYQEGLALCREIGDPKIASWHLVGLAGFAVARGQVTKAVRLLGAVAGIEEALGLDLPHYIRTNCELDPAAARAALGEAPFAAAWAEGRAMPLEDAIEYGLEQEGTAAHE